MGVIPYTVSPKGDLTKNLAETFCSTYVIRVKEKSSNFYLSRKGELEFAGWPVCSSARGQT